MRVTMLMLLVVKLRAMGRRVGRRFMNIRRVMSLMTVRARRGLRRRKARSLRLLVKMVGLRLRMSMRRQRRRRIVKCRRWRRRMRLWIPRMGMRGMNMRGLMMEMMVGMEMTFERR
jgi:hypothetical protein